MLKGLPERSSPPDGASGHRTAARSVKGQVSRAVRHRPPAKGELSRREREVLELLAQGCTNREIAERLFLSQETVKSHVRHAMLKLGARTRTHAVALSLERGYIGPGQAADG